MKKLLFLAALLSFGLFAFAGNNNSYMVHHANWWNQRAADNITNVTMEVTPKGLYAEVALTFNLKGNSITTGPSDSLQGILNFELPPNSFIHDSWLWLNDTIIIRAALFERSKAIQIYSGYIQRRQDPSLLVKTGTNTYQLNVFPITNSFPRKVKIVYSTLMSQARSKAMLTLPTSIFCGSQNKPDITAIIHTGNGYQSPSFAESSFSSFVTSNLGNSYVLAIPASAYDLNKELNLVYFTNNATSFTIYPTGPDEGIYEMQVASETFVNSPRYLNFILDHRQGTSWYGTPIYEFAEVKRQIRTFLLTHCLPTDSFNIFYVDANNIVQAFPGWGAAEPSVINATIDNIPNTISSDMSKFKELLEAGILFGQAKPSSLEHTILISKNNDYQSLQVASQLFTGVFTTVGNLTNKISVINYGTTTGSEILFNNFCSASGGTYYKYSTSSYDGYLSRYTYDLDIRSILKGTLYYMWGGSNSYNVSLPVNYGFSYSYYNLCGNNKYFSWLPYYETGKYYGDVITGNITINYVGQSGPVTRNITVMSIDTGTDHQLRCWVNNYLLDLESMNSSLLYSEILDTSINNRVLCYKTAFLALENGDTVGKDSTVVPVSIETTMEEKVAEVKCFPNPFTSTLSIESPDDLESIEIFDITGRLIFSVRDVRSKVFTWNGLSANGQVIGAGMYIVKVRHNGKLETFKVTKL